MNVTIINLTSIPLPITIDGALAIQLTPDEAFRVEGPGPVVIGEKHAVEHRFSATINSLLQLTKQFFLREHTAPIVKVHVTNHGEPVHLRLADMAGCLQLMGEVYEACAPGYVELREPA